MSKKMIKQDEPLPRLQADSYTASVKVMRSYDYCHFEVCLGTDEKISIEQVNDMRKKAALLVDEAVRQYKMAMEKERDRDRRERQTREFLEKVEFLKKKPQTELSPEQAAILRSYEDQEFWKQFHEDDFLYEENPEREYHFSMLHNFKNNRVKTV